MRIGDTERERAITLLGEHFTAGRLDVHEYDERCAGASAARFHSELSQLFQDLPDPRPALPQQTPAKRPDSKGPGVVLGVTIIVAALALAVVVRLPAFLLLLGAAGVCLMLFWRPRGRTK